MQSDIRNILDFTLLFNKYKVPVFNYVLKMVADRMTAEDLVQNIFLKLHQNISLIKMQESINFWLFRTARNEVYGWYRKQKAYRKVFDPADLDEIEAVSSEEFSEEIEMREISGILNEELNKLPPDQKEVFILKEYGGLSYREISEVISINEELVKSRLFKIRKKLTGRLANKI